MIPDVVVYVSSVANPHKHPRKTACLESFAIGVQQLGKHVLVERQGQYHPSQLAVILGWATASTKGGANIALRKQIILEQQRLGAHVMCIDASCFKYLDNHSSYLRYSIGGPYYDQANYANHNSTADQWNCIKRDLGVDLYPEQNNNGHVLICMQRDGGFSMKEINPILWLDQKIQQIRKHTNRPILIRPHPGTYQPKDLKDFVKYHRKPGITVANPLTSRLTDNLKQAQSAVFFNSSASVAAVCAGVPVFVDDSSCVSWSVANTDIAMINSPQRFDRTQWMYDLAAAHWTDQDGREGRIYQHFMPYL